ncbi:hypothetical protein T492DRAFT_1083045 [Pavlovales sp. CCMP2436]|nr:hypothetical protein T492DRAFT_1083045 [Pavlovales sp. CCMP2436]
MCVCGLCMGVGVFVRIFFGGVLQVVFVFMCDSLIFLSSPDQTIYFILLCVEPLDAIANRRIDYYYYIIFYYFILYYSIYIYGQCGSSVLDKDISSVYSLTARSDCLL